VIGLASPLLLAFPPAHQRLWARAKSTVWREISAHWNAGTPMREVLVIAADSTTITSTVLVAFHRSLIISRDDDVTVAIFVGAEADHFTRDSRAAQTFRAGLAKDDFTLVVVDQTERSIISSCRVRDREAPN
jgi:hypothetical protein